MNREAWLNAIAQRMAPRFDELAFPLPKFRISVGFTSGGSRGNSNGECWSDKCSADGAFEIFLRPDVDDPMMAAAITAHELVHAAVGLKEGHKGNFIKVMAALGFTKPWTATIPTEAFRDWVQPFIDELGPIPHGRLRWDFPTMQKRAPGGRKVAEGLRVGLDDAQIQEIITSAKPKQTARLKKACCAECGYTVRVTQKWLDIGPPHCPQHGAMSAIDDDE